MKELLTETVKQSPTTQPLYRLEMVRNLPMMVQLDSGWNKMYESLSLQPLHQISALILQSQPSQGGTLIEC